MANQEQLEILKQGVDVWNEWREENVNAKIDLELANLEGAYLWGVNLSGANLSGADLSGAKLGIANLNRARLNEAHLNGADLRGAYLEGAELRGANLSRANLSEAYLKRVNLSEANLNRVNLNRANLSGANLSEANLSEANLSEANLGEANLSEADLRVADLNNADLHEANFYRANLSGADLRGSNLYRVDFEEANLDGILLKDFKKHEHVRKDDLLYAVEHPFHELQSDEVNEEVKAFREIREKYIEIREKQETFSEEYKISIAHPKLLSKRYSTLFLVHIYLPEARHKVDQHIKNRFNKQEKVEHIQNSKLEPEIVISVRLQSPDIVFSDVVTTKLVSDIHSTNFTAKPNDNCFPGTHPVILSIFDPETKIEYESFSFNIEVRDFSFDHVSRPLLSQTISAFLGVGSLAMYALTLLGQIDTTFGLASGTVAVALASGILMRFQSLYKKPSNISAP